MKALIIAVAATFFMAGSAFAADDMNPMSEADCTKAMIDCKDDMACKQKLVDNNNCKMPTQ